MIQQIEKVIGEKVRPYLGQHGGNIKVLKAENGIVEIKLLGQCSGCPSAKYTVEDIVETSLKQAIPEIKKVVVINEVSEELLDMARKILNKKL